MAENNMTIHEAVDLITNSKLEFSDEQLAQINEVFYKDFLERHTDDVKDARDIARGLAEERITALYEQQDSYDAADLDNIIALANSISSFTSEADKAKAVLDKAQKQKEALEANKVDEVEIGINEENEKEENTVDLEQNAAGQETENTAEEDPLTAAENIPEDEDELKKFDEEYGIDKISEEQLETNKTAMNELDGLDPFALNEDGKLVQPDLQEEYDVIQKMEITDDEGKPLPEEEQKKAKGTLLDTIVYDAEMLTRGTAKGDAASIKAQYISNLKAAMQKAVVSTAFASEIEGKPQSKEAYGEAFAKAASQEGGLKTSLKNVVAYAGIVNSEMTKLKDRLKARFGEIPAVKDMSAKAAAFDERMSQKHPEMWKQAKRISKIIQKRAKGAAIYSVVGATAGPIGLAVLAVKGGYDTYKNFKKEAEKEGVSFRDYAKAHKFDIGLAAVSSTVALTASAVGLGAFGDELGQAASSYLKTATRALAIAPKAIKAGYHRMKAAVIKKGWVKGDAEKEMAAAKAAFDQTIDASIGMVAGAGINAGINAGVNYFSDKDGDGIIDGKDVDHGEGWATANEKQLDSMMNDSESVNAILGEGHNHTPEELRDMLAKGAFTDEQLKGIHALATKGFDENGVAIDQDKDGIADYKDLDHGAGWSANDKQLESLMKDAESVNAALGEGHNHTPEELSKMLHEGKFSEAQEGGFTKEQIEKIHTLASSGFDKEGNMIDKDQDGIADYKDLDHGAGWSANDKQLERLMEANPFGVNAILGDGKEHSSAELSKMLDEGKFSKEQLEAIHKLASSQFDKEGHITDPELKKYYEDLARQAKANANANAGASDAETPKDETPQTQPEVKEEEVPENKGRSDAEQKMYDSILETISKGENMADPTVKTSVEGLAEGYLDDVKSALASGKEQEAIDILQGIHKQGEDVEVREATQREADDSRGVRHAKEDLSKVYSKLDDAKEALAADPDNEKLQKEVDKLEKEFDKKSLNLDNKEIKQEKSELNTRIDRDNTSAQNLDWTRGELEKIYGVSQEAADKQLIAAGFDLKNLPENTENLPENVQKLINAHNQYAQVDRTEAALHGRVDQNEDRRDELKSQEKENKEAMKEVKKGHGFSQDDEKRIKIEDRLPGQSDFRDSNMASSLVNMVKGGAEEVNGQTSEQGKESSNAEAVDKFLKDQVAQGNMTEAEAQAKRAALIEMADQKAAELESKSNEEPEKAQEKEPEKTQEKEPEKAQEKEPEKAQEKEPEKAQEKEPEKAQEKEPEKAQEKEPEKAQEKEPEKAQEKEPEKAQEKEPEKDQNGYRANDLSTLKNDYLEDIEKNHGLNDVKNIFVSGQSHSTNGQGSISLAMVNSGSNGYAMIAQDGAESFVIDNENKTLNFRVGSGDNLRDMTYSEAKEFTESIMKINNTESAKECVSKYQLMCMKLYEIDKEAYAQDMQQEGVLSSYAKTLGCDVDKMREIHHETNTVEKTSEQQQDTEPKQAPEQEKAPEQKQDPEQEKAPEQKQAPEQEKAPEQKQDPEQEKDPEPKKDPEQKQDLEQENVGGPLVAETPAGSISYEMTEDGHLKSSGTLFTYRDQKEFDAIKEEIAKNMGSQGNPSARETMATAKAQTAYMADAINKDVDARLARGEDVPHAEEIKALNNAQLKKMGLEYDKDGKLHSVQSNTGNVNAANRSKGGR